MQSKESLEDWYKKPDPWDYYTTPDDQYRKEAILESLKDYGVFKRALDIGAGEGFITKDLPALEIHGLEISDTARARMPEPVLGVTRPHGKYDLVITTGTLYYHYDFRQILDWIKESAEKVILVAGIKDWFVPELKELGTPKYYRSFPYREYQQEIRIHDKS